MDRTLCVRFDAPFAAMTPEDFVRRVLVEGLGVQYLVVGDDFRFGHERRGDFAMLQAAGREYGFQVVNLHSLTIDGARVSSTRIRAALAAGDLATAEKLLGRPYRMCGRVAHGDKRPHPRRAHGQYPPAPAQYPAQGRLRGRGLRAAGRAARRRGQHRQPAHGRRHAHLLEVHLLDFDQDIYGKYVQVNFLRKLRDEQRFGSLEELKHRIRQDIAEGARVFEDYHPTHRRKDAEHAKNV